MPSKRIRLSKFKIIAIVFSLLALVGAAVYYLAMPAVASYVDAQKPIQVTGTSRSSGEFSDTGKVPFRKGLTKGETASLGGLAVTLLGYDETGVELNIPDNLVNEALPFAKRPATFTLKYGENYVYHRPGGCCGQSMSVHYEMKFKKR